MSLDQLRSFVSVAETGSVIAAAKRLCLTQPPVSRQILRLEDELGAPLFTRQARGMSLTDAGTRLLPVARRVLRDVDRCVAVVHAPRPLGPIDQGERTAPVVDEDDA